MLYLSNEILKKNPRGSWSALFGFHWCNRQTNTHTNQLSTVTLVLASRVNDKGLYSLKWEGAKKVPLISFKKICLSIITQQQIETVFLMNKIRPLSLRIVSNSRRTDSFDEREGSFSFCITWERLSKVIATSTRFVVETNTVYWEMFAVEYFREWLILEYSRILIFTIELPQFYRPLPIK